MNILITGANGFIGKYLIDNIKSKHKIFQLVNGEKYSFNKNTFTVNLLDLGHINLFLKERIDVDMVIHLAAVMCSNENQKDFSLLSDNIKIYENLVLIIKKFRPTKIINFSSTAVYPNKDGEFSEVSEIKPSINNDSLYGLAKFCGENILDIFCNNANIVHLRVAQVIENERGDRIFEVMKRELSETNNITVYGNGRSVSSFISINNLIQKVNLFIENNERGIFNTSEFNLSYKDLALNLISKYGDNSSSMSFKDAGLSSQTIVNNNKLKKLS
jgi:2-alkyl-3-oxoalkanoate reductase